MHRIDTDGNVGNLFSNGNPATGVEPTIIDDNWCNAVQEEICNAITAAGIALVKGTNNQLQAAISYLTKNITGNVTITGDLVVNGTTITQNAATVLVTDNLMVLNNGEAGAGVTTGFSGLTIDRGSLDNFAFLFDEVRDGFAVGTITAETPAQIATMQMVATREDTPTDRGVAIWDNSTKKFVTHSTVTVNTSGHLGINVVTANINGILHAATNSFTATPVIERSGASTDVVHGALRILVTKTSDMSDGFGCGVTFNIRDDANVINIIGAIYGVRAGGDTSGRLRFDTYAAGSAVERMTILSAGQVGVNTTAPAAQFAVNGIGTAGQAGYFQSSGSATRFAYLADANVGVQGQYDANHYGRLGTSNAGVAGHLTASAGVPSYAVYGDSNGIAGNYGGYFIGGSYGVYGTTSTEGGSGVKGVSTTTYGVVGDGALADFYPINRKLGNVHGQTSTSGIALLINSSGVLGTTTSSIRFKENVMDILDYSEKLYQLRPVSFNYKASHTGEKVNPVQYGLIAEEVKEVMPELIHYDEKGEINTIYYQFLTPLMLNEIIKLKREINLLKSARGV